MTKILQILLFSAILNPLCCCDAAEAAMADETGEPIPHGCCSGASDEPSDKGERHHGREDCPHLAGNGYQQTMLENVKSVDFGIAAVELPEPANWIPVRIEPGPCRTDMRRYTVEASRGPPGLNEVYCVYLI